MQLRIPNLLISVASLLLILVSSLAVAAQIKGDNPQPTFIVMEQGDDPDDRRYVAEPNFPQTDDTWRWKQSDDPGCDDIH